MTEEQVKYVLSKIFTTADEEQVEKLFELFTIYTEAVNNHEKGKDDS